MERLKKHHLSLKNAFKGILWVITTEYNFQIHLVLAVFALIMGFLLQISSIEMIVIIFAIVLGLSAEMINTAIEELTDLVTVEWRKEAKIAKDVSAGMMLLISLGTLVIGLFIFIPKLVAITLY